ncbi:MULTISPECIES: DMT family transporter [Gammaproteobacteria]|jgi:drug/metabolite transporter (DMT)-like permease|uniref:Permease of the drug/metabolite transporter (DMT) superfamily n=1 Tax=Cycloclasticus zancles 78-ME TaxID=1198232 RepID=S5TXA0_9GAMM|nr:MULTISPECIES: DMT family transporter [Cycloclasticus]AGS39623.1 Permease of the drug/metabolite transporter (DMT) superfamily [Cycloclasticus zancles 78-ME]MDF1690265.1 DMT family transporter [Cycloclasticus sp.]MDF1830680.1 DMT family transporter [Cycloclasticus pugetii]
MLKTSLVATTAMLLWAICYPLITLSLPYAPIMLTAFLRAALAGMILIVLAKLLGRSMPKGLTVWIHIIVIGLTATSIGFWGMFYAGSLISPGLATVITNTQPMIAAVFGWYFLDERLSKTSAVGIIAGFIGILIISVETVLVENSQMIVGILYILIAATGVAISNVLLKKLSNKADILYTVGFQLLIGAIPLGLLTVNLPDNYQIPLNLSYLSVLLALALLGTALPYILWFWLMDKAPLYKLNVFSFLTPIFGLILGSVYFSESLSLYQWGGVFIIVVAILWVNKFSKNKTLV